MKKTTRREFVSTTAKATSLVALAGLFPPSLRAADCAVETLLRIGEIASEGKVLKGVLKIKNTRRNLPKYTGSQKPMMRYFEGYSQHKGESSVWPPKDKIDQPLPGPTLRVGVGERVEITFLNQTEVSQFGLTYDRAEVGDTDGCDQVLQATPDGSKKLYPEMRGDKYPNCFHASSSANLHFHGTHITPDAFGDNVLVQVRPDPKIKESDVKAMFDDLFAQCRDHPGHVPQWMDEQLKTYRESQEAAVLRYDNTAVWKGKRGDGTTSALPEHNQLTPENEKLKKKGLWPAFFVGAYPNCFTVTEKTGHSMGQAPGTHWYHAHKHGSTSINLFNGLAGALIIEGQYDKDLAKIYPDLKEKKERVIVVQFFTDQPNLERPPGQSQGRIAVVNGKELTPTDPVIVMRPGEIQLWRIVNARVMRDIAGAFTSTPPGLELPKFRQIAQDGVQFRWENYDDQPLTSPVAGNKDGTKFTLAPGGRIDILVKAPSLPAGTTVASYTLSNVVNLKVCGAPVNEQFPTKENYPEFPPFLEDIPAPSRPNELSFDWEPFRLTNGAASASSFEQPFPKVKVGNREVQIQENMAPFFMIDKKQFTEGYFDQVMVIDRDEVWTLYNTTSMAHPFHIHVNPFQVVEVYDPNTMTTPWKREKYGVWQDVVNVPPAKTVAGKLKINKTTGRVDDADRGYVKFRGRFVDFPGTFVLHCHILAHEDRGMMQLVKVVDNKAPFGHH